MSVRQKMSILSTIVVSLLAFQLPSVSAQGTNATCLSSFDWMTNSRGQSPCLVAAYLNTPCLANPVDAYVFALPPGFHYRPPTPITQSPCQCSSVFYSLLEACALCQGDPVTPWSTWTMNCTDAIYESVYQENIPSGTAVPAWAYLDVHQPDTFNVTGAQALANSGAPESTAAPSATNTRVSSSLSSPTAGGPSSGGSRSSGSHTNVGAIVGGVIGGVVFVALVAGGIFFFMRRRNNRVPPSAQYDVATPFYQNPATPYNEKIPITDGGMSMMGSNMASTTLSPPTTTMTPPPLSPNRIYDPNDPSTFPSATPDTSISPSAYTQGSAQPFFPQNGYQHGPGQYRGAPEL